MEYLFDNPRPLFVLLFLALYAAVMLFMAVAHWIVARVKRAGRLATMQAEGPKTTVPPGRTPEVDDFRCPGGLPSGACSCR
jgi:hypothetical protein